MTTKEKGGGGDVKLHLSVDEVNQILAYLSEAPYKMVFPTIQKIQSQAQEQLQEEPR